MPDITDLDEVEEDNITPRASALNFKWEVDYPNNRILIFGEDGAARATAPFETLTIQDNDGNADTITIKVYSREFVAPTGDYEVINYRLLNIHDAIILPNSGAKMTQYMSQGWEAPESQDTDVIQVRGNQLVAVGTGSARIDWGRHQFIVEVREGAASDGIQNK